MGKYKIQEPTTSRLKQTRKSRDLMFDPGRKAMINLDSMFKSIDFTLLTKVRIVKAMVFPAVMYGCES